MGARADVFMVIFALQTTTIFQGRQKPTTAAVELMDWLCLISICKLFNKGPEIPGTTKSQRLTSTKQLLRKKVCKTSIYLMTLKKHKMILDVHNWALK